MPNSQAHNYGTEKNKANLPEPNGGKKHHTDESPRKKESLKPEIKREYELLHQYIVNFNGSSF